MGDAGGALRAGEEGWGIREAGGAEGEAVAEGRRGRGELDGSGRGMKCD